jgi:tetratricopeptide (TPR) repeat protein
MKKILPFLLFFLGGFTLGFSQENASQVAIDSFSGKTLSVQSPSYFLFLDESEQALTPTNWEALQLELDAKASKKQDSLSLLRVIFQKTHQRLLKDYTQHSSFADLLKEGDYDCVSGSAALGLLLDRYGFSYDVVETDYHVFIQVYLDGKTLILESTLPVGGMITSPTAVSNYLAAYSNEGIPVARNINEGLAGTRVDASDNSLFRKVNLFELAGLQHYNEAIVFFNRQDYKQALEQLNKALSLYPSERIEGLRDLSIELAYHTYGYDIRK